MKWTIWHTASVLLIGLAFAGVTAVKYGPVASSRRAEASDPSAVNKETRQSFWALYRRATRQRTAGHADSAATAYRAALQRRPNHENSLYYLGHVLWTLGQRSAADSTWRRLVEVNPESARGYTQIGEAHFCVPGHSLFDLTEARTAYRNALDLHNEETGPLLRLGTIALLRERSTAADRLDALMRANSNNPDAPFLLGYLAWQDQRSARATVLFRKAQTRFEEKSQSQSCPLSTRLTSPLRKPGWFPSTAYTHLDSLLNELRSTHRMAGS